MSPVRTATHPTLYRIHPVSFRDGNGDGVGDVHGMMAALPYLKALAVDGLLLPQALSPEAGAEVTGHGLALWHSEGTQRICRSAAPEQHYARSALALEVVRSAAKSWWRYCIRIAINWAKKSGALAKSISRE
ncbi:Oligo-1,6-glucosidase [Serratia fonticola]|uniref:Oligo-1,6-glucosidase n=1 Tax=Serratia fonticola TaxID=47917 RepID=A0A4U9TM23_SERFO|nr:Oligo-1,6-glucosidase [Serratia fonticola]